MKRLLTLFVILLNIHNAFCQKPVVQRIADVAEVTFPDTLRSADSISSLKWVNYSAQSRGLIYSASLTKSVNNSIFAKDAPDSAYKSVMKEQRLGDSATNFFYKKNITAYGLRGFCFAYRAHDSLTTYHYFRCFYFNNSILWTSVISPDSLNFNDKRISGFFNSLKFNLNTSEMQQENFADIVFTPQAALICILVFLSLILLLFLLSKLTNRNR